MNDIEIPHYICYHYTSMDALYSIVENKEIYLTNLLCSNDETELKEIHKRTKKLLEKLKDKIDLKNKLSKENANIVNKLKNHIGNLDNTDYYFINSFKIEGAYFDKLIALENIIKNKITEYEAFIVCLYLACLYKIKNQNTEEDDLNILYKKII